MFVQNRNYWKNGQKTFGDIEESEDEHSHCRNCFRLKCQIKGQLPRNSCIVITCPHLCGASFHSCKADEHKKLCRNEMVPCINSLYGCPRTMRRSECGHHLATCPASVVYCTMEWNRWPVFSKERQDRVPFVPRNHAMSGQLDAALAMRDQRILYEAMRVPRRVCRSLRNRLTERFPAVPLMNSCSTFMAAAESSKHLAETMSDRDESVCNVCSVCILDAGDVELNLFQSTAASEITTEDLTDVVEKVHVVSGDIDEDKSRTENDVIMVFGDDKAEQLPMQFKGCDNDGVCGFRVGEPSLDNAVSLGVFHDKTDVASDAPGFAAVVHNGKELTNAQTHSFLNSDDFHASDTDRAQIAREMCNSDQDVGDLMVTDECVQELLNISAEQIGKTCDDILGKRNGSVVTSEIDGYNHLETFCERGFEKNASKNLSDTGLTEKTVFGRNAVGVNGVAMTDIGKDCADHVKIQNCPEMNSGIEESLLQNPNFEQFDAGSSQNIEFSQICSKSLCRDTLDALNNEVNTEIHNTALKLNDDSLFHFGVFASSIQDNTDHSPKKGAVSLDVSPGDINHVTPQPDQSSEMFFSSCPSPPTNPPPLTVQEVLSLDLNLESITRYQAKPRSMYTFLCAQNLRRDEYEWHFKNTHSEIHGGLNGWIEARCPLACYGCTYSIRRLNPLGGTLVYNTDVDSFGVRPDSWHFAQYLAKRNLDGLAVSRESSEPSDRWSLNDACDRSPRLCLNIGNWAAENSTVVSNTSRECISSVPVTSDSNGHQMGSDDISKPSFSSGTLFSGPEEQPCGGSQDENSSIDENILSVLPFEVLRYIARCLDSFSLCNLAMTCFYLREVCKSIVEDRGIVVQEWQKRQFESGSSWQVTYQRWFFSTSFSPVDQWRFVDAPSLSEHLKICPFNVTSEARKQPFRLCFVANQILRNPGAAETLQKMYPEFDAESEDVKTNPPNPDENLYINGIGQNGFSEYNRVLKAFATAHKPEDNVEQDISNGF